MDDRKHQRSRTRQRFNTSRVFGRKSRRSRRLRRSCEIERSRSGIAKPSSFIPATLRRRDCQVQVAAKVSPGKRHRQGKPEGAFGSTGRPRRSRRGRALACSYPESGQGLPEQTSPCWGLGSTTGSRSLKAGLDLFALSPIGRQGSGVSGDPLESGHNLGKHRVFVGGADQLCNHHSPAGSPRRAANEFSRSRVSTGTRMVVVSVAAM